MHLSTQVAKAAVRSKGMALLVVDLLLIVDSIVCGSSVFDPCFIIQYFVSF